MATTKTKAKTKRKPQPKVKAIHSTEVELRGTKKGTRAYENWQSTKIVATKDNGYVTLTPYEYSEPMCTRFKFSLKDLTKFVEELNKSYKLVEE